MSILADATESLFGVATIHTITPNDVIELTAQRKSWSEEKTRAVTERLNQDGPMGAAEYLRSIGEEKTADAVENAAGSVSRREGRAEDLRTDFKQAAIKSVKDVAEGAENVAQNISDNKRLYILGAIGLGALFLYSKR